MPLYEIMCFVLRRSVCVCVGKRGWEGGGEREREKKKKEEEIVHLLALQNGYGKNTLIVNV